MNILPVEEQLRNWVSEMEQDEPTGIITYERFSRVAFRVLSDEVVHPFDPVFMTNLPKLEEGGDGIKGIEGSFKPEDNQEEARLKTIYFKGFDNSLVEKAFAVYVLKGINLVA